MRNRISLFGSWGVSWNLWIWAVAAWGIPPLVGATVATVGKPSPSPPGASSMETRGAVADSTWQTDFERSGGFRTPRYDATVDYCKRLAQASSQLNFTHFGTSAQGRQLPLLVANNYGDFKPGGSQREDNVVVLVQACIHAGECCGKDAGLMLLRDLTVAGRYRDLLDHVTLLFIPIFNVDGHERFSPYNRINQNGPEEMGWRVTAQNLNLNRDFLKADTPEMQAWLNLFQTWKPDFFVDIHTTDGADFQYAITYCMEIYGNMHPAPTAWSREYLAQLTTAMAAAGYPISPYVMLRKQHDIHSGINTWVAPPRFSQGYTALHDVPGLLIEAHMLKPYNVRVDATYQMLIHTLKIIHAQYTGLKWALTSARAATVSPHFCEHPLALSYSVTDTFRIIDFLGVDYETVDSDISGGKWHRYGNRPTVYQIPFYDQQEPRVFADLPEAYILPPEWHEVIERLEWHGVKIERLTEPATVMVRTYRFWDLSWREQPYEGRHPVSFQTEELREDRNYPAGSAVVDMRQPTAKVIAHVLEPHAPDSYVSWGFFDAIMARVEYFESYVMEKMAREMLAADPALHSELAQKKATDTEFTDNPRAILDWFYRRTPYFNENHQVYPVGGIDDRAVVEQLPTTIQR